MNKPKHGNADGDTQSGGLGKPTDDGRPTRKPKKLMLETMVMAMLAFIVPRRPRNAIADWY